MRIWVEKSPCRFTDEKLIEKWLSPKRKAWFENPKNDLFGCEERFRAIAEHWLYHGKHGPDYDDRRIMYGQRMWDEFLELFTEENTKEVAK